MGKLHPGMRKVLDNLDYALKEFGLTDFHSAGVETARVFMKAISAPSEFNPPIDHLEDRNLNGPGGELPIRIYKPFDGPELPALVWFHGGGFVMGDLDTAEFTCRKMANEFQCVVISVDYRLAPETPFPGALDDCYFATEWVYKNAVDLGIAGNKIAVGGDSAGGNLAAGVTLRARDKILPLVFQLLVYPGVDTNFDRVSYLENANGYLLTRDAMIWFWDQYVPDMKLRKNPEVAPIKSNDLSGLPAAFIITAEFDPLRDEGEEYGTVLKAAGVDVEIKRYNGMIHGFFNMLTEDQIDEINQASKDAKEAIHRVWGFNNRVPTNPA